MRRDLGKIQDYVEKRFDGEFKLPWRRLRPGIRGHASSNPWHMDYVMRKDDRGVYLEFYVTNRFIAGDIRERVYASGEVVDDLATIRPFMITKPEDDPEEVRREYEEGNLRVARELRDAGVFPEHDINAHLRTNPELGRW
jgi:hypothetical protein